LAPFIAKASICILIKVLAAGGSTLLAFISSASFNARVVIVLRSRKLLVVLVPLYKNLSKLTLPSFMLGLIAKS